MESAAGLVGVAKACLSLYCRALFPTAGFKEWRKTVDESVRRRIRWVVSSAAQQQRAGSAPAGRVAGMQAEQRATRPGRGDAGWGLSCVAACTACSSERIGSHAAKCASDIP
jgi:hypothetical protein